MNLRPLSLFVAASLLIALPANACKCGGPHAHTAWEVAKLNADSAAVIFEGTLVHAEMSWQVLEGSKNQLGSAAQSSSYVDASQIPHMAVIFRVLRTYKGDLGSEVQLNTGMGGGDCGASYFPGLTYLIYATSSPDGSLWVSICSPGGWIGDPSLATNLRYLRTEHPANEDLRDPPYSVAQRSAVSQAFIRARDEESRKRWAAATGKICGKVVRNSKRDTAFMVAVLPVEGYSPFAVPYVPVHEDGSFCSLGLGPGKYYLFALSASARAFYPGVNDKTATTLLEVAAGKTLSGITLNLPDQETYTVRGLLSVNNPAKLYRNTASVVLIDRNGRPFQFQYRVEVDFTPSSLFHTRYFTIESVLPGHYTAYVFTELGRDWFTRPVDVVITSHSKFLFLSLAHGK